MVVLLYIKFRNSKNGNFEVKANFSHEALTFQTAIEISIKMSLLLEYLSGIRNSLIKYLPDLPQSYYNQGRLRVH